MGQNVIIKLKTSKDKEIERFNDTLDVMGCNNIFITEQMNVDWVNDINTNPESHQSHLKPITLEELKQRMPDWCEVGKLVFDIAFDRTSQKEAEIYARFIEENHNEIEYIKNGDELIYRYKITGEQEKHILNLNLKPKQPKKLPKKEQYKPDLQSGLFLCKSFSPKPFWVVFGKVDEPTFLKEKIYVDDLYNNIYKDKNEYGYLLMPLHKLIDGEIDTLYTHYDKAWLLGLREHAHFILPLIYNLTFSNYKSIIKDYQEFYSQNELLERFEKTFKLLNSTYEFSNNNMIGFHYNDRTKQFKSNDKSNFSESKCHILNCLTLSITDKSKLAQKLSDLSGKPYKSFEFEI